jgi:hypothetical protein
MGMPLSNRKLLDRKRVTFAIDPHRSGPPDATLLGSMDFSEHRAKRFCSRTHSSGRYDKLSQAAEARVPFEPLFALAIPLKHANCTSSDRL